MLRVVDYVIKRTEVACIEQHYNNKLITATYLNQILEIYLLSKEPDNSFNNR